MIAAAPYEVGITVADLERVKAFYTAVLGLHVVGDVAVPAERARRAGLAADGYRIVRLEAPSGARLKLAQPLRAPEDRAPTAYAMQRAGGFYLTFLVDDLDAVEARLAEAGVPIRSDGQVEVRPGFRLLLVTDAEGNWVELLRREGPGLDRPRAGGR